MDDDHGIAHCTNLDCLSLRIRQYRHVHLFPLLCRLRVSIDSGLLQWSRSLSIPFRAWMLFLSVPLWVIELSPPRGRSILGGIVGLSGVIGYLIAGYIGVGFFYYKSAEAASWRAPIALGCFPPLIFLLFAYWLPESPRWLLAKDRYDEAWEIVRSLHATNDDPNHEYAMAEMYQMNQQHELDRALSTSWMEMLRRPSYRKRAAIAFVLPWIMYSTGDLVVTSKSPEFEMPWVTLIVVPAYAASIFGGIGYDASQTIQFTAAILWAALVGNLISLTYVDRVPRHIILSVGVLAVLAVLIIETALQASFPITSTNRAGLGAAGAFIFIFLFTFNLFLEGPGWYYVSEIFPTHLRAKGMTINIIGLCCVDLTWLELAPTGFAKIGWKFYLIFICISIFGAAVIFFTFPDTLRKPLEEVARLFGDDDLVAVYQEDNHREHEKHDVLQEKQNEHHVENTETREDLQGYNQTTHGGV